MDRSHALELLRGLPLRSRIACETVHEKVLDYSRRFEHDRQYTETREESRIQAILKMEQPIVGDTDFAFVDANRCIEARLSPSELNVADLKSGQYYVEGVIPLELHRSRDRTDFREILPLPKYDHGIDSRLSESDWLVVFAAISELNPDQATLCPFARVSDYYPPDPPSVRHESNRLAKQRLPIDRLKCEVESADAETIERFTTGRGIVIEELRRECFNALLAKVRSDETSTSNLVASDGERPEFLTVWHSPHWPAADTPQAFGQWLTCTRRALDHWVASFPSPSDCDDDVSRVLALQALEDADTLARHLRDRHGITDVPLRPADESLSAAKRFLDDVALAMSQPAGSDATTITKTLGELAMSPNEVRQTIQAGSLKSVAPVDDATIYRLASELWPERTQAHPFFSNYDAFKRWFDKIPETQIRRRKPSPQRLEIHEGDWSQYWKTWERDRFEMLGASLPALLNEAKADGLIG